MAWFREVPATLSDSFWDNSKSRKYDIIVDTILNGLRFSGKQVERGDIEENILNLYKQSIADQIDSAAELLAEASKGYLSDGPKGPRPVLISLDSIGKVCGANTRGEVIKYKKAINRLYSSYIDFISPYTASNIKQHPDLKFSHWDLARGIYIPKRPEDCPMFMGILAADGVRPNVNETIKLEARFTQADFYLDSISKIVEETINSPGVYSDYSRGGEKVIQGRTTQFKNHDYPKLKINSRAFTQWLRKYFPTGLKSGILCYFSSGNIEDVPRKDFVHAFLAAKGHTEEKRSDKRPHINLANSQKEISDLLNAAGINANPVGKKKKMLQIGVQETEELLPQILAINPAFGVDYAII